MKRINPILRTDSYKHSHFLQYPPGTERVTSYIEARGFAAPFTVEPEVVFFGLQAFIKEYLTDPITKADVNEAEEIVKAHGEPFNREGWDIIVNEYDGFLPLFITALKEGTVVQPGIPLVQVCNTAYRLPWLTSWAETELLRAIWYPTTVATLSREAKKVIKRYLEETGDVAGLPFKLHDFGARGVSSSESAVLGGMAHLVNFMGTDTMEGLVGARRYYGAEMAGFSIPASEHSTITSWGGPSFEKDAFENMLIQFGGEGKILACVSDSYDLMNAVDNLWGIELNSKIQQMKGTLVVRPDSGDPVDITLQVIEGLGEKFGYDINDKGYKVLNPCVRIIQGDGVNITSIEAILENFKQHGWSADNIAFGMGGGLLQSLNRDSLKFAMKANEILILKPDGTEVVRDVFKDPITDPGKHSKKGAQIVVKKEGRLVAKRFLDADMIERTLFNQLQPVYIGDGKLSVETTFEDVRLRATL